ncbi:MAG: ATP-binding protein [Candidatus Diapherotrites archaeon]|nr:ATP-binding protein [Candidatus Diapherotrites archaeon]
MIEKNIKKTILKYKELIPENIFQRDLKLHEVKFDKANVIVGPRRSGKTFFLYNLAKKQKNPVLINFEDNLLGELKSSDLNKILDCSKELFEKESLCFFLDEIQNVNGWEKFVVSLLNEHYPVYITGSNSKLLSREIATSLRGKALPYLMLPLSFKEHLRFKGIVLQKNYEYTDQAFVLKQQFKDYFKYGSFPEVLLSDSLYLKNKLLNTYFDSIVYKDLVDRLNLKNIRLVEITIKYLLNIYGNMFSISVFEKYLKSNKIPYSLEDIYNILKALQDVFMVNYVKEYSKSFKKSEISRSKVYLFDTGYIHFLSGEHEDYGRILENIVFIELFRRQDNIENKNIFYYKSKNNKECDFVITNRDKVYEAIQVTYDFNELNREREINGLLSAVRFFNLKKGLILTYDQDDEFQANGVAIKVMPVWKWSIKYTC